MDALLRCALARSEKHHGLDTWRRLPRWLLYGIKDFTTSVLDSQHEVHDQGLSELGDQSLTRKKERVQAYLIKHVKEMDETAKKKARKIQAIHTTIT